MFRIFHWNESVSCVYLIWLSVWIIHDVTLTLVIISELHNFKSWINLVVFLWILYVMIWSNPVMCYIHNIIHFCHVQLCTLNVRISIFFCHAQLWTNDIQYYYRFSSCTSLYKWISIFFWIFVMHISVRMTFNILLDSCHAHLCTNDYSYYFWFSFCTNLYEWLSIFF